MYNKVTKPNHYRGRSGMFVRDVIDDFDLNFNRGNIIKYVLRAGRKPGESDLDDLRKALDYIKVEIAKLEDRAEVPKSDLKGLGAYSTGASTSDQIVSRKSQTQLVMQVVGKKDTPS